MTAKSTANAPASIVGWDIGGVNTKAARVERGSLVGIRSRAYELQRDPAALVPLLRALAADLGCDGDAAHAVTMTAELSQMFRTKREGVGFVLDAVTSAFPLSPVHVWTTDGTFLSPDAARTGWLQVAAANWRATAVLAAGRHPDALLVDVGTTTTDIVPLVGGRVAATGLTDPDRLLSGELVYSGALRTPVEAMVASVPYRGGAAGVSAEGFAIAGDVYVWRGDLAPGDYTVPAPDGRPATREFAGERLARVVCGDREMLEVTAIDAIAEAVADAQAARLAGAMRAVLGRHPSIRVAVVTGLGAFVASAAARRVPLPTVALAEDLGAAAARCAPAASVALLLDRAFADRAQDEPRPLSPPDPLFCEGRTWQPLVVVKIGGGMLADPARLDAVIAAVRDASAIARLLLVPGGGPFADTVRSVDVAFGAGDDAAHWMAILAMDQYAHLIASRLPGAAIVRNPAMVAEALAARAVPVLAPYTWLRAADPLPHSWDVTSDSLAAWIADALGAEGLILVKPPGACGPAAVDPVFARVLRPGLPGIVLPADRIERLPELAREVSGTGC